MKKCPFCCEEIQDEAVKCKHCGEVLTKKCSYCAETIPVDAKLCPHCRSGLEKVVARTPIEVALKYPRNPGVALILSFIMPGFGQFYNGHVGKGILFLALFWLTIWTFVLPIVVWVIGLVDAYESAKKINQENNIST